MFNAVTPFNSDEALLAVFWNFELVGKHLEENPENRDFWGAPAACTSCVLTESSYQALRSWHL
ncbi:hypothetical protein ARTHRO9V_160239 [Arthrobacter sp. 9V]|nr:hypothetical protein ARTHRO9V_160239 [Arthrobacter sp. 9V]